MMVIRINGKEVKDSFLVVDATENKGQFSTLDSPWLDLDLNKLTIEINIHGDICL